VLDLSTNIAGPLAAMVLGDLGAELVRTPPPALGEHTEEVLREAGLDEEAVGRLSAAGTARR
jgi:crotonobetainyl-CoA:carnitine CoA-transferase CaiB-like acyl-CoA transferase